MTRGLRYIFSLSFSLLIFLGYSQEKKQGIFRLEADDLAHEVSDRESEIVSASRTIKNVEAIPVSVYIVTRQEILENGYITLVDALKSVPGIRVSQPGSAIEGETFLMRGLHGNYYCKILIDGVMVQPSVAGGMPLAAQFPVRQAERIEITFGPSSSIYGADALAGVINIVTHVSDRPVTAQADISLGSDALEYLNVTIGGKAGRSRNVMTYSIFGNSLSRKDMRVKKDIAGVYNPYIYDSTYSYLSAPYYVGDSNSPALDRLPESSRLIGFTLKWRGLDLEVMSMSRKIHSSIGQVTDVFSYAIPSTIWGETIQRYTVKYEYASRKFSSLSMLSYLNYRLDNQTSFGHIYPVGSDGNAYKYSASDDISLEEQLTFLPIPGLELTGGLSLVISGNLPLTNDLYSPFGTSQYHPFSDDQVSDTVFGGFGYNPVSFYDAGGYLQLYFRKGPFILMASDRYDYHSRYKGSNSPRIALQFDANEKISILASIGQGFRAPSTYYTYSSLARKEEEGIYYITVPNENLKQEKLFAAEAGIRWTSAKRISFEASVFFHRLANQFTRSLVLLDPELYPDATNPLRISQSYVNDDASRADLFGLQAVMRFEDIIESIHLGADLEIAASKGKEILPNELGTIDSYRQWPELMGQLNVSLRPARIFYLYIRNIFSSGWTRQYFPVSQEILDAVGYDTRTKGYYTMDLVARISVSRNFEAFLQLNNLFNAKYGGIDAYGNENDLRYNPQFERNFRIGLSFSME